MGEANCAPAETVDKKWQTQLLQHPLTRRHLPSSSRGLLAPSRARLLNQARRDSEMTSPAWRVLAQTSQWCAHGKPSVTWSSATWRNMELSRKPFCVFISTIILPCTDFP